MDGGAGATAPTLQGYESSPRPCVRGSPTGNLAMPQGITNQIMVWAVINALITLALMPFAPKRASRGGIVGRRS